MIRWPILIDTSIVADGLSTNTPIFWRILTNSTSVGSGLHDKSPQLGA